MTLGKNIFIFGGFHIFHLITQHKGEFKAQETFKNITSKYL